MGELTSPAAYPAQSAPRYHSAADYHAMYKSGAATPLQAAMALLPYITGDKGAEHATAWTACKRDEVLAEARASTERWAAGKPIGVLDGVPFGVKCDTPVAGYVNTFGIKPQAGLSFFKKVQEEDCWPVKKMREAGAVMVGRLNMHEVGMDTTGCNVSHRCMDAILYSAFSPPPLSFPSTFYLFIVSSITNTLQTKLIKPQNNSPASAPPQTGSTSPTTQAARPLVAGRSWAWA